MAAKALIKKSTKSKDERCADGEVDKGGPPREGRVCAVFRTCAASKRV